MIFYEDIFNNDQKEIQQVDDRQSCNNGLNRISLIVRKMGQQCCSDDKMDNRAYNASKLSVKQPVDPTPNLDLLLAFQGSQREYQFIRNFSPVDVVPKLHHNVQEIQEALKPFKPTPDSSMPVGTKDPSAYAVNNVGLIYDANSEWQGGLPHGNGRLIYPDGSCYTGSIIKGVPSGQGRFVSSQGWYYEGGLFKEQAQGKGVFAFEKIGYRYEGEWEGDLPNGKGHQTWVKVGIVSTYQGQYLAGKKHGKGKYKNGDDWQYQGQFSSNEITSGRGIMKYKNGELYEGSFLNGKKHGFGTYRWKDGSVYEGWYGNDKKQGHGKFTTSDGRKFEGEWQQGRREGRGVLIVGGKKYPGQWHNDQPTSTNNI